MHTCPPWLHLRGKRLKSQFRGTQTCVHIISGGVGSVWGSLAVCARLISHHLGNMEPWRPLSFTYRYRDSCSFLQESKTYINPHTHTLVTAALITNRPRTLVLAASQEVPRLLTLLQIFKVNVFLWCGKAGFMMSRLFNHLLSVAQVLFEY